MIRFSIITCTWNAEAECERTFDSVMQQSYPLVEHIIQDGLSTDRTPALAEAYKRANDAVEHQRHEVTIVQERDHGLYDAMNRAMQRATGDYVLFLNAGDTFPSEDTLQQVADAVGEGEQLPSVLYGDTDVVDNDGHFVRHRHLSVPQRLTWRSFRRGMLVCHQAFYALTSLAQAESYDTRLKLSADVDWCIRVMRRGEQQGLHTRRVAGVVALFLDGGLTTKRHRSSLWERFRVMTRHYGLLTTVVMHCWFVVRGLRRKNSYFRNLNS